MLDALLCNQKTKISHRPTLSLIMFRYRSILVNIQSTWLFFFISLFTTVSVAADSSGSLEPSSDDAAPLIRLEVFDNNNPHKNDNESAAEENNVSSSIERFVQPFTRWAEDQIHDAGLIRSPSVQEKNIFEPKGSLTLREAIQHATSRYPGTVLSANKVIFEENLSYQVKIISAQGVVKTIKITEPNYIEKGQK